MCIQVRGHAERVRAFRLEDNEGRPRVDLWLVNVETGQYCQVVPKINIPMVTGATLLHESHPTHPNWLLLCAQVCVFGLLCQQCLLHFLGIH